MKKWRIEMKSIYRQKLFIVFNQALGKARKSNDYLKIKPRLVKALGILQSKEYYVAEKEQYQPTYYSCNCPDWQYHLRANRNYKGHCKHMISVILMERINSLKYIQTDFFQMIGG
jgi:predicted nucleic acid-binding Zn finger protein